MVRCLIKSHNQQYNMAPTNEDAEGMCTSVASLEPDPRYSGCCSSIFRPGRVLRDIVVGALVVIAIAVVIAVVFVVCFFFIPAKSAGEAPQLGEEGAFHGRPHEGEEPYRGINEVEFHNSTRYEVDPQLEKVREGEKDSQGHDHEGHEGHDHSHDHGNHTHDHEGHEEHHHVGPVPETEPEPEPESEPEPTAEPEPEPEATPEPEPEGDHTHGQGPLTHDHTHPEMDHNHTHPEADHDHTHPAMDHEHTQERGPVTHDHTHPEMDHDHTHPEADHDHTHPDHGHAHPAEAHEHAEEKGQLTHDHAHPEMDHDHTHPAADHDHIHPEMDHDHTHPAADHDHTHPDQPQEKGPLTHDHTHPEMDHDHTHPEMDHDHTHPEIDHDHTHPAADHDHTHPAADHDHIHPAEDHENTQEHGPVTHDHTHPEMDHDHTHPAADHDHTHEQGPVTHDHTHPEMDHDHTHPAADHDHTHEQGPAGHDHIHPAMDHDHTHPEMDHDHLHPTDGTPKAADTDAVHHVPEASESEVTVIPTIHSPSDREESSLPPLFELFSPRTPTEEHTEHTPEGSEGTLKELIVPQEHQTEEPHHQTEAHPEVAVAEATEEAPPQGECQPRQLEMCNDLPHTLTAFPNWAGDQTEEDMQKTSLPFMRDVIVRSRCSPRAKEYSCAILEPPCTPEGTILPPCRTFCKSVASTCQEFITSRFSLSSAFDCDKFPDSSDPSVCFDMTHDSVPGHNTTTVMPTPEEAEGTEATLLETTTLAEEAENTTAAHCPELQCLDGTCISLSQVNDGVLDCPEGIDEEDFGGLI